ncbi:hypothetical protein PC117_g13144 [Phytophthora cactorum]|uniref:Uncharacterized protein n=1 Tax=Phytophthora cactorum TaxID=29920 RepID=A0A8T1D097_9STRA|nr:hypothetical protein PC117_g13144 [Phytophthora cactorum]
MAYYKKYNRVCEDEFQASCHSVEPIAHQHVLHVLHVLPRLSAVFTTALFRSLALDTTLLPANSVSGLTFNTALLTASGPADLGARSLRPLCISSQSHDGLH